MYTKIFSWLSQMFLVFFLGCSKIFTGLGICEGAIDESAGNSISLTFVSEGTSSGANPITMLLESIKMVKGKESGSIGSLDIVIPEGEYKLNRQIVFTEEYSGEEGKPIIIKANGNVTVNGGLRIDNFKKLKKDKTGRIKKEVLGKVYVADLKAYGLKSMPPLRLGGFGNLELRRSDRGYKGYDVFPFVELFYNGKPMPLARYPNDGFTNISEVKGEIVERIESFALMKNVRLKVDNSELTNWAQEPNVLLHGYWFFDWADSYESVRKVYPESAEIELESSSSAYGYKAGARFYALNLLCELDQPGEWYLNRENMLLYFYPPGSLEDGIVEFSWFEGPMFIFENAKHIHIEGLNFKLCSGNVIEIHNGEDIQILGCSINNCGGYGIVVDGGKSHLVQSCNFQNLGKGGVFLRGGDRKTLTPSGFKVDNCYFYNLARVDHTYNPAVYGEGVGHIVSHNFVHKNPSSAFRMDGNDIIVEYNEVCDVVLESDDQGALDTYGNPTYRGMVYRYNYWHHIGNWDKPGLRLQGGVRLDFPISGVRIYGNVFYKASAKDGTFGGVQVNGGKDNIIENNIFADCFLGVTFQPCTEEEWENIVKEALSKPDIDLDLYVSRYPEMAEIYKDRTKNTVRQNIFWKCTEVMRNHNCNISFENNIVNNDDDLFPSASQGKFEINEDKLTSLNFKFETIPFSEIGLYKDKYRKEIPEKIIEEIRKK